MTVTQSAPARFSGAVNIGDVDVWVEQRGDGPDVLLIAGLGDPAEAWQFQLDGLSDRYRVTAFDNRGAGRTPLPEGPLSVESMADDCAALLRALDVGEARSSTRRWPFPSPSRPRRSRPSCMRGSPTATRPAAWARSPLPRWSSPAGSTW